MTAGIKVGYARVSTSGQDLTAQRHALADARDIADELTAKGVALKPTGSAQDLTEPVGRLLFNVLGMVAEFESDLIHL